MVGWDYSKENATPIIKLLVFYQLHEWYEEKAVDDDEADNLTKLVQLVRAGGDDPSWRWRFGQISTKLLQRDDASFFGILDEELFEEEFDFVLNSMDDRRSSLLRNTIKSSCVIIAPKWYSWAAFNADSLPPRHVEALTGEGRDRGN